MMKNTLALSLIVVAIGLLHGCGGGHGHDHGQEAGTSADHQITQEDASRLNALGRSILDTAKTALKTSLVTAMKESGPIEAVKFCNVHASGVTDDLAQRHGVKISRISNKNRVPANIPDGGGFNVLQRFDNGRMNGNMNASTLLTLDNGHSRFYEPILVDAPCLTCHGMKDEMVPELVSVIDSLYPNDKAKGFKLGDLRGAWVVDFQNGDG